MQQERQNRRFLPDIEFPESLHLECDRDCAPKDRLENHCEKMR